MPDGGRPGWFGQRLAMREQGVADARQPVCRLIEVPPDRRLEGGVVGVAKHGGDHVVSEQRGDGQQSPDREQDCVPLPYRPPEREQGRGQRHTGQRQRSGVTELEQASVYRADHPADQLVGLEQIPPGERQGEQHREAAQMAAGVVVDGGMAVDPADGTDHCVQRCGATQRGDGQQHHVAVDQAENRKADEVETEVLAEERIGLAVLEPVPAEQQGRCRLAEAAAGEQPKQQPASDAEPGERPQIHRFTDLEVADPAMHLHRTDGPVHEEEMSDEPAAGKQHPGDLEEQRERAPVGHESGRARRLLRGPEPLREQPRRPATGKEHADEEEHCDRGAQRPRRHA